MVKSKYIPIIVFVFSLFNIAGCNSINTELLSAGPALAPTDYLIGPGDSLQIIVWRNPDVSSSVSVRPDGKISTPLISDLSVVGKKVPDVAKEIEDIMAVYIRKPQVYVIVSGFKGVAEQQVRVLGSATSPKIIPYHAGMSLLDVMIQSGGLSEFADGDNAQLFRTINGEQKQYTVKLDSLVKKGDFKVNRYMYPGDTIIIPEAWF